MNTAATNAVEIPNATTSILVVGAWTAPVAAACLAAAGVVPLVLAGPIGMVSLVGLLAAAALTTRP